MNRNRKVHKGQDKFERINKNLISVYKFFLTKKSWINITNSKSTVYEKRINDISF